MTFLEWILKQLIKRGQYGGGIGWWMYWMCGMVIIAMIELCTDTFILLLSFMVLTVLYMIQQHIRNLYKQYRRELAHEVRYS